MNATGQPIKDDIGATLETLREGLALITTGSSRISVITRLSSDVDSMWLSMKALWDSVGETDEIESGAELGSLKTGSKYYGLPAGRSCENSETERVKDAEEETFLASKESAAHAGSTLAASVGTSVVSLLPSILVGTQSVYTTLVPAGFHTAIPTYVLQQSNRLVVDHYTVYTSAAPIVGWFPHHLVAVSPVCIPAFSAVFLLASSLDSLHSFSNNHCSLRSALVNSARGAVAGGAIGGLYYGLVSTVGIAHAPLISAGLSVTWLLSLYFSNSLSSADLVVGSVANVAGISAFLLSGNPVLSVAAALLGSALGSAVHSWGGNLWTNHLLSKLEAKAREVLQVDAGATKQAIESQYRKLARLYHPDKHLSKNGSSEHFELIHVAKQILLLRISAPYYSTNFVPELPAGHLDTPD